MSFFIHASAVAAHRTKKCKSTTKIGQNGAIFSCGNDLLFLKNIKSKKKKKKKKINNKIMMIIIMFSRLPPLKKLFDMSL